MNITLRRHSLPCALLGCLLAAALLHSNPAHAQNPTYGGPLDVAVDPEAMSYMLGQCLGRPFRVREDQILGMGDRRSIGLESYQDQSGRPSRLRVILRYNGDSGQWEPTRFETGGEMNLPAAEGLRFRTVGAVYPLEAEALHAAISRHWRARVGAAAIKLDLILSSRRPKLDCRYYSLEPQGGDIIYFQVIATGSDLPTPSELSRSRPGRIIDIGLGNTASLYYFLFRQNPASAEPQLTGVSCASEFPPCDEQTLASLREGMEVAPAPSDNVRLREAMIAALPPDFHDTEIEGIQAGWRGNRETVTVQLDEVATSERRRDQTFLECSRYLSVPSEWRCMHRLLSTAQSIPGQEGLVARLQYVNLPESEVNEIVTSTVNKSGIDGATIRLLTIRPSPEPGYLVTVMSSAGRERRRRQLWFSPSLELLRIQ